MSEDDDYVFRPVPKATGIELAEESSAASVALTTATTVADTEDMLNVSSSAKEVNNVIIKYLGPVTNNYVTPITAQANNELDTATTKFATDVNTAFQERQVPHTHAFRCYEDYRKCIETATSEADKWGCRVTFAACIGQEYTTVFGSGD